MADIRTIDFNTLPRTTRERFVAITKGLAGPAPLFSNVDGGGAIAGWIVLLVIAVAALLSAAMSGFGSIYRATQSPGMLVLYIIILFFAVLPIFGILKRARTSKAIPFKPGVYVFPMDTVIARDKLIKIIPLSELTSIQPVHHYRNGIYMNTVFTFSFSDGTRTSFSCYGQPQAQMMMERFKAAGGQIDSAVQNRDVNALNALDPFFEPRMNGWAIAPDPQGPMALAIPGWMKMGWLFALVGAVVLSPVIWAVRNVASDQASFSKAKRADSSFEYEGYLWSGWLHTTEVRNELLPRAKLKEAKAKTTTEERIKAIQEVIDAYPTASVRPDADKAMTDAIHDVFTDAKAKNSITALRDFQKKYPKAADVPAAKSRIHELFQKTLADFRPRASKTDPNMIPFVESLLTYMEANDSPPMEVRFRRHNGPSLAVADKILAEDDDGDVASVSGHFDAQDSGPREKAVVDAMKKGFVTVFPTDVLAFTQGADFNTVTKAAVVTKPTILVDYTVNWSGTQYVDKVENRRFVGVIIDFDVLMVVPSNANKLDLKFSVRPPQRFTVSFTSYSDPAFKSLLDKDGPSDSQVYEVMALRAFDELSTKVQDKFFQKKPAPKVTALDDDDED